jgi:arabinose-5-phosphate isomerase
LLEREGPAAFHRTAEAILHAGPRTVGPAATAGQALTMMEDHKITSLLVTEDGTTASPVLGVLHIHDILS